MLLKDKLRDLRLIPVVSLPSAAAAVELATILTRCRLPVAEVTFRTPFGAEGLHRMREVNPDLLLLAGTVLNEEQVDAAMESGAAGIVSPGLDPSLVRYCLQKEIPVFPGACTPSEVQQAMALGLTDLKFFPAEISGGIRMVRTLLDVYRTLTFMPTGGVTSANLAEYLSVDRVLCCGGSWLAPEAMMAAGEWQAIEDQVRLAVKLLADISGNEVHRSRV